MMAHASKSSSWPSAVAERRFCVQAASCSGGSRAFLNALYQQLFLPESRIIGDVAYCTDTNFIPEETFERLAGLDILVLDCLRQTRHSTHFSLEESLEVARRVGAKRTLFLHFSHDISHRAVSAQLPPGMELAYDGLTVPLTGL